MISVLILHNKHLYLIFLLTSHLSILHAEKTEILLGNLKDNLSEPDLLCQNTHFGTLNYDFEEFCPKLISIFKNDPTMEQPVPKILHEATVLSVDETKEKRKTNICTIKDKNIKLLASLISNHQWNFTDAIQHCHHNSLKSPEYDHLPCEMKGELNGSMPLEITTNRIGALFSETSQICATEYQFLLFIYKIQNESVCLLKVQQHKINVNLTEEECGDKKMYSSCGLYPCSYKQNIYNQFKQITRPMKFSNVDQKPFSDYQFQKPNYSDKMKKKTTIADYFFELLLVAFIIILIGTCFLTNCCGLNDEITPINYNRTYRYGQNELVAEPTTYTSVALPKANSNYKLKCAKKSSCVCSSEKFGSSSGNKKWGFRGDEESYGPERKDSSSKYIPTVMRG